MVLRSRRKRIEIFCLVHLATSAIRPNVIIFFVDDWGWGDLGENCLHAEEVPGATPGLMDRESSCDSATGRSITPHMDELAKGGLRFTDFHAAASVCTPSRAALQTGRLGARTGVINNFNPGSLAGLPTEEKTLAELLRPQGYATCAIGKWHVGPRGAYSPTSRGYDTYLGIPESHDYGCTDTKMGAPYAGCLHWRYDRCPRSHDDTFPLADHDIKCHPGPVNPWNYSVPLILGTEVLEQPADLDGIRTGASISSKYAAFASEFIVNATSANRPFFLYMAFNHVHVPIVYAPSFAGKSGKGVFGDALMELDRSVGEVLATLDSNGARQNTLIWLAGDNGPPESECDWGGSKGPFLGRWQKTGQNGGSAGKWTAWEAGHRVVGVVSWPTMITSGVSHALASTLDIVPTVASLAGVSLPSDRTYDGINLQPVLFNGSDTAHTQLFFSANAQAYEDGGPLFEAVRLPGISAMFKVGTHPQCCRGSNGDANTPHNSTCSPGGRLGPNATWFGIMEPLLFDMSIDVAQAHPVAKSSPAYSEMLGKVLSAMRGMNESLRSDLRHVADYSEDFERKHCCNPANPVCRCTISEITSTIHVGSCSSGAPTCPRFHL